MVSFKILLGVLFGLVVVTITALAVISYRNNKTALHTAELVRQTHQVLDQTDEIGSLFKDIQLASNTYFANRDSSIIRPYVAAREEIYRRIDVLKNLTSDNPGQQTRIELLRRLVDDLILFTNTGVSPGDEYAMSDLNARIVTSFQYRRKMGAMIQSIEQEERRLLRQRENTYRSSIATFSTASFLLLAGIGILLAATFFSVRYNFNRRIRAQDDLKKANELFVNLFYESPIAIVISNFDTGVIIDCNKEYTNLLRFSKSEVLGKTAVQLGMLNGDDERIRIVGPARSNNGVYEVEAHLKPKNSGPIWVSISMQRIRVGNEDCLLSAILDMTVHKQAEEKMKQALATEIELNKLKSNFVTLASHEFRTPLTALLSSASLIERYSDAEDRENIMKHVSRIKAAVKLLTSILNDFLSLSKIEEGRVEPKRENVNLRETVETVCQRLRMVAKRGQKIIYRHSGEEQIFSDPTLLGNILNNLLSNAIKYSHENSEILVTSVVDTAIHVSVKDFGIGISDRDQAHLFERFFRASNAGDIPGTGLGLHIMKHYVDLLNGTIDVRSQPGIGTEFNITFE